MNAVSSAVEVKSGETTTVKPVSVVLTKAKGGVILAALQSVTGIVERRGTLPILANVLITKQGPTLEFTSTDLELQMRGSAGIGFGESEVATTVNARKITDILKALPAEQAVTLTLNGDKMVVTAGKSRFQVQTLPAGDFPLVVQSKDAAATLKIEEKVLLQLISQVQHTMAVHDIRFYMNGLLMETEGSTVTVVATDGHRLATASATLDAPVEKTCVILPRKAVMELARLLKTEDGAVEIRLTSNQAVFQFSGIEFTTKLLEGKFPDYRRVIPANLKINVTFERVMLLAALQRAELMSSDKFKGVELNFSRETLELSAANAEQEEAREEIGIDYEAADIRIGFNVHYLIEGLANMTSDTVNMALLDGHASVLITEPDAPTLKLVVMPMRV
jgi:DNA polymerase-3 subunit beta